VSFGFYHFACIMLLTYKPGPKFAIRNAASLSDTNVSLSSYHSPHSLLTPILSISSSTTPVLYAVHANARQGLYRCQSLYATPYSSGDLWSQMRPSVMRSFNFWSISKITTFGRLRGLLMLSRESGE
jgi:hypothetical protein